MYSKVKAVATSERRIRIYRTDGLILNRRDWREADRLITLFSPTHGKQRVVAPGARKPQTRKSGHLELFTRGHFVLAKGRTFDIITQAETQEYFPTLHASMDLLGQAALAAELSNRFLVEGDENALLYDILLATFARLDAGAPPQVVLRYFELRMLALVGYQPNLFSCSLCGDTLQPVAQHFGFEAGGVVCPRCAHDSAQLHPLSLEALKVLRFFQTHEWPAIRGLRMPAALAGELERILHRYCMYLLDRDLTSPRFLNEIRALYRGN